MLVDIFQWSLYDIDRTDVESLLPFVFRYPRWKAQQHPGEANQPQKLYADQVNWL